MGDLLAPYWPVVRGVVVFVLAFAVAYLIGRTAVRVGTDRVLAGRDVDPTLAQAARKILGVAVGVAAVGVATAVAGFGSVLSASAVIVGALTLAVGLATQNLLSNLVSGVFIVSDDAFRIGDWIRWDGTEGVIEEIDFRVTRVRTFENELVTVPNSVLTATAVTNTVATDRRRITYPVAVPASADVDAVKSILEATARATEGVVAEPAPRAVLADLGTDQVEFEAWFWVDDPRYDAVARVRSDFGEVLAERLPEADAVAATE